MRKIFVALLLLIIVVKAEAQTSVLNVVDDLLLKGNYQEALILLDKQDPKTVEIIDKTAGIYQTIGNYTKAIEHYQKALEISQNEAIKVKLGMVYKSAGLTSKAIAVYEEIIEKDTSNLLVANSLGKLYLTKNIPEKAEKLYRYLKKKDTLNPNYPYQLAVSLSKQKRYLKMGQSYLDAYNLDTLHVKSMYELAKFFKELRMRDSSVLFIDKGLIIDSTNVNFLQLKANDLYFTKDFENAIVYLNKLDSLHFKSLNTYEMFGMSYFNLKKLDSAENYFKKALKIEREEPKILYRLASLYYEQKNNKLAKIYLMRSVASSKPDIDKQYLLLGIIAKEEYKLKEAIAYFDKAVKNNYRNQKALFQLALTSDSYYKDKKIALRHYQKFVERYFEGKDKEMTAFAEQRIKEIRKQYFIEGEIVD